MDNEAGGGGGKGVTLAIGIILLWLAGLGFFIAFEGSKLLGNMGTAGGDSASFFGKLVAGLRTQVGAQVEDAAK